MTTTEQSTPNNLALSETTSCCCATQDTASATGHGGRQDEVDTVLTDGPTVGTGPTTSTEADPATGGGCCGAAAGNSGCC